MTNTCMVPETCTTDCLFTCKPCTRYGFTFTSLLRIDMWFGADRRRNTLWRAQAGEWVEVASSTSARVLADAFTSGAHVVMPAGVTPRFPAPMAAIAGALF